jgi:hypothetical protein
MTVKIKVWFIIVVIDISAFLFVRSSFELTENQGWLLFVAAAIFPALAATLIYKVTGKDLFSNEKNDL